MSERLNFLKNRAVRLGLATTLVAAGGVGVGAVAMEQTGHSIKVSSQGIEWLSEGNCEYDPNLKINRRKPTSRMLIEFPKHIKRGTELKPGEVIVVSRSPIEFCE